MIHVPYVKLFKTSNQNSGSVVMNAVCGTMMSVKVSLLHLMKKRIFAAVVARNVELDDGLSLLGNLPVPTKVPPIKTKSGLSGEESTEKNV